MISILWKVFRIKLLNKIVSTVGSGELLCVVRRAKAKARAERREQRAERNTGWRRLEKLPRVKLNPNGHWRLH